MFLLSCEIGVEVMRLEYKRSPDRSQRAGLMERHRRFKATKANDPDFAPIMIHSAYTVSRVY